MPSGATPARSCDQVSSSVSLQGLAQLEILCKQLYETTDTAVRHQAEKALVEFTNSPDCLSKCQLLLERGSVSVQEEALPTPSFFLSLFLSFFLTRLKCSVNQCRHHPLALLKVFWTLHAFVMYGNVLTISALEYIQSTKANKSFLILSPQQ